MYNKKGLSAIVATVLIILLVIAGVTLVWSPIRKLISDQSKELESSCLLANTQITKACRSGTSLLITVSNGAEGAIDSFQVVYGINANTLNNTAPVATNIGINEVKTLTVSPIVGAAPTAVKIAPVINGQTCAAGAVSAVTATC